MCMIHSNIVYPSSSDQLLWNTSATHGEFLIHPSMRSSLYTETSFLRNQKWTFDISYSCSIYHTTPKICPKFGKNKVIYTCSVDAMTQVSQFSRSVMSDSLRPHGLQHARPPCPSPTTGACSNSCPSSQWCHPTISSSVVPFSCLQYFPASGSFLMSQFFASGGQSTGVSASVSVHKTLANQIQ